jgi:predicted transcriptional regulator
MAALQLVDLPDEVYRRLEQLARVEGKPLSDVAARLLAKVLTPQIEEEQLLAEIRAEREVMAKRGVFITDDDIRRGRDWGRQ